ncbi:hypothetical protein [Bacillus cereus]|uniref:hypothetical protein n=1 Tax=Bacillus cereus TaxID=1396 RepID=UPI000BFDBDD3|nr:hypothetical protein [Bacillus cereus]PGR83682.1 hypothetical protein COC63_06760 [Bacillus cereus]
MDKKLARWFVFYFMVGGIWDMVRVANALILADWWGVLKGVAGLVMTVGIVLLYKNGAVLNRMSFGFLLASIVLHAVRVAQFFWAHDYAGSVGCWLGILLGIWVILSNQKEDNLHWEASKGQV